tara:strand:+ start:883 stop:1758 length:876 start_codon:yes stop_codon:yes gene_type:complete
MLLGIIFVDLYGVIIKSLGTLYSTPQLTVFRNFFAVIPIILFFLLSRGYQTVFSDLNIKFLLLCFVRGISFLFLNITYYIAIINMDFATASTLTFSSPFFIIILSIILLKHKVGIYRWSAVIIGFIGVVMIMRPTNEIFSIYSIYPILTALIWAFYMIILRFISAHHPPAKIEFYTLISSLVGSGMLMIYATDYVSIQSTYHWTLMIMIGIFGGTATVLFIYAYRMVHPSKLAAFEYLGIPSSFVLGWIFFSEAPLDQLFPGIIGIVAAGFIVIWRDRKLSRELESVKKIN